MNDRKPDMRKKASHLFSLWQHKENAVAQLVEALRYKPEGGGFNSLEFFINILPLEYGAGIDTSSNRNGG